ncbi:MAG TPA: hypothetical protein VFQ92_06495 [Blastocatellia bacterium]|nr:hypothetical protein [Blastocatellia bacterium]
MKIIRTVSIVILALAIFSLAIGSDAQASVGGQDQDSSPVQMTSIAPPFITPDKESFTVREGDSLVIVVNATCMLEDEGETGFEFLSVPPDFIRISSVYRSENREKGYVSGLAVVHINPQAGDAGRYQVGILARACTGKVERLITFQVKVKKSKPTEQKQ